MTDARLERHVLTEPADIDALVPVWQRLAASSTRSVFQAPGWLVPWWRHYGKGDRAVVLAWSVGSQLVGIAPLHVSVARRLGVAVRELSFWGTTPTPLRGSVDILAAETISGEPRPSLGTALAHDMVGWLAGGGPGWDLFHYLRLPIGSPSPDVLRRAGFAHVNLTGVLQSDAYVLDLPARLADGGWLLGAKARHNIRTQSRGFQRLMAGEFELVTEPDQVPQLVAAIARQVSARWGADDAYFHRDPRFAGFAHDAIAAMFAGGDGFAVLARDPAGIQACLVNLCLNRRAVALLIGVNPASWYRAFSLGKILFDRSIIEAVARGCVSYDFLWANGYKSSFWHGEPQRVESGVLGRGPLGRLAAGYVGLRRVVLPAIRRRRRA